MVNKPIIAALLKEHTCMSVEQIPGIYPLHPHWEQSSAASTSVIQQIFSCCYDATIKIIAMIWNCAIYPFVAIYNLFINKADQISENPGSPTVRQFSPLPTNQQRSQQIQPIPPSGAASQPMTPAPSQQQSTSVAPQQQAVSPPIVPPIVIERLYRMSQEGVVDFYDRSKPLTEFLGNFFLCDVPLTLGARTYFFRCAEAAFQAGKFYPHRMDLVELLTRLNGEQAFAFARQHRQAIDPQWTGMNLASRRGRNLEWMRNVVHAKFTTPTNVRLRALLCATLSAALVEHIPVVGRDAYWGDNGDGTGQNQLGQLLMQERALLTHQPASPLPPNYLDIIARREQTQTAYQ